MSHFSVMVICDTVEELETMLAPYQENNMGDCPKQFLEFNDITEEYREKYCKESVEFVHTKDNRLLLPWDDEFRVPGEYGYGTKTHKVPDELPRVNIPYKILYSSFDEYMQNWCGEEKDPERDLYGYWENPNAKWDWYQIGGRWKGLLKAKNGEPRSEGLLSDMDFSPDREAAKKALDRWDQVVNGIDHGIDEYVFDSKEYFEKTYGSAEFYAKSESEFRTYAVITPDGKWHAKGEMGWFGCSNEDADDAHAWIEHYAETFIEPYADRHAFIVDCHI